MAKKISIAGLMLLVVVGGLLIAGVWKVKRHSETVCGFCNRPIQPKLGVVAEVGGRTRRVCCARCAITEARQESKALRLISVTDYTTGRQLPPEHAWYVEDSRAVACNHDMAMVDQDRQVERLAFDRCSPGTFAFARKEDANAFVARNGGVLHNLQEMLGEVKPQ